MEKGRVFEFCSLPLFRNNVGSIFLRLQNG
jgi:hypothetical protein